MDVIANSADRKVGHCIVDTNGHLWGIDNGLTLHEEPKLRTVLWAWVGERIPDGMLDDLRRLAKSMSDGDGSGSSATIFDELLSPTELRALRARVSDLMQIPRFPEPDPFGPFVPWPPY